MGGIWFLVNFWGKIEFWISIGDILVVVVSLQNLLVNNKSIHFTISHIVLFFFVIGTHNFIALIM